MREVPFFISGLLDRPRFDFYSIAMRSVPKIVCPEQPEAIAPWREAMIRPEPASM